MLEHTLFVDSIMVCRLVATAFAALSLIVSSSLSYADPPSLVAELDASQRLAEARAAQARAEADLANWRFTQLKELQARGHASWQEVAEQDVIAKSVAAAADASDEYWRTIQLWRNRVGELRLQPALAGSESIQLYLPQSARLVAWLPAEVASSQLLEQHLENLRGEHQSLVQADLPSLKSKLKKAEHAVEIYTDQKRDPDLARRAEIRLRIAEAEYASARARRQMAEIVRARIKRVRQSLDQRDADDSNGLARPGTRFVDASCHDDLARRVASMAADDASVHNRVQLLRHQREELLERIGAFRTLARYAAADPTELAEAQKQHAGLQAEIETAEKLLKLQQEIAVAYQQNTEFNSPQQRARSEDATNIDHVLAADASSLRYLLQLKQRQLQTSARLAAIGAQKDYLDERFKRVKQIPEDARAPKELTSLRHRIEAVQQQWVLEDCQRDELENEQQRFRLQARAQRGDQYQLVQTADGGLMPRLQFEMAQALVAAIGFVGTSDFFLIMPATHPYLESTLVRDCIARLSLRSPGPSGRVFYSTAWGPRYHFLRRGRSTVWDSPYSPVGLRLATDGITYPVDLFCYQYFTLRRLHVDDHWSRYEYLRPSITCGFRSYYPFGSYAFGLDRPSKFSFRNKFPPGLSRPYRDRYVYRSAVPTRSILYSSPYLRPISPY